MEFEDDELGLEETHAIVQQTLVRARGALSKVESFLDDGRVGQAIREGVEAAILGPPNSGKSSLLNALAQEELAIVSETPGTTRDVVSSALKVGVEGILVRLHDTAGLRDSSDAIEQRGVEKARRKASQSDLVLWVFDYADLSFGEETVTVTDHSKEREFREIVSKKGDELVVVVNKIDLAREEAVAPRRRVEFEVEGERHSVDAVFISCKEGRHIGELLERLREKVRGARH